MVENKKQLEAETHKWVTKAKTDLANYLNGFIDNFGGNKYTLAISLGLDVETIEGLLEGEDEITLDTLARLLIGANKVLCIMDAKDTPISFGNPELDGRESDSLDNENENENEESEESDNLENLKNESFIFANGIEEILNMILPKTDVETLFEYKRECCYSDDYETDEESNTEDIVDNNKTTISSDAYALAKSILFLLDKNIISVDSIREAIFAVEETLDNHEELLDVIEELDPMDIVSIENFLYVANKVNPEVGERFLCDPK